MTPQEIRDAIAASPALQALAALPDYGQLAKEITVGRTRPGKREIGFGTILDTIGLAAGNTVLDIVMTTNDYRYVRALLEQGRLIASSPLVVGAIQGMVTAGAITQAQGDALIALGREPETVSSQQVIDAVLGA
jgi:hypothetical protein